MELEQKKKKNFKIEKPFESGCEKGKIIMKKKKKKKKGHIYCRRSWLYLLPAGVPTAEASSR